jgi:hypothetical protein
MKRVENDCSILKILFSEVTDVTMVNNMLKITKNSTNTKIETQTILESWPGLFEIPSVQRHNREFDNERKLHTDFEHLSKWKEYATSIYNCFAFHVEPLVSCKADEFLMPTRRLAKNNKKIKDIPTLDSFDPKLKFCLTNAEDS